MKAVFCFPNGEFCFMQELICVFASKYPKVEIVIAGDTGDRKISSLLPDTIKFVAANMVHCLSPFEPKVFITSEQYFFPPRGYPSICCFHGQPSKGLTLTESIVHDFNYFFAYGPFHYTVLTEYCEKNFGSVPKHLKIEKVGYTKSDPLLQGHWQKEEVLQNCGLDPNRKTILYAPAFNEGASLREFGIELIESLCTAFPEQNLIIKLSVDNFSDKGNVYANGGIDWFEALEHFTKRSNVYLPRNPLIDPYLAAADVLVTDVSSVSFEFMVLGKPVVFIETPRFFSHTLGRLFPGEDPEHLKNMPNINAGREFGFLAKDLAELPSVITQALEKGYDKNFEKKMRAFLLYNPGSASETASDTLYNILQQEQSRPCWHRVLRSIKGMLTRRALSAFLRQRFPSVYRFLLSLRDIVFRVPISL